MQFKPDYFKHWSRYRTPLKLDGLRRIISATRYSLQGLQAAWRYEESFRQEVVAIAVLIPVSIFVAGSVYQWLWMFLSCTLVVITELLNSAIEAAVDRWGEEQHELIGRAKDLGSAAVFVALTFFFLVWSMVIADQFILDHFGIDFWPA